ncbi:MAG: TolC family protein [Polyangiaceae bacterium]|nr:TolC family protein [Polyangiaceae bacterium]
MALREWARAFRAKRASVTFSALLWTTTWIGPASAEPLDRSDLRALPAPFSTAKVQVTWQDILRLADQDPRLVAGRQEVDVARGAARAARAMQNPMLEASLGRARARSSGASRTEWGLALTVPLGWIATREAKAGAAAANVDAAAADARALRREVLLELQILFWRLAYEQARLAMLEELRAQTFEWAQTVQRRVQAGDARPVESTRVEIELAKVSGELSAAHTALGARQAELGLWLRVPKGKTLAVNAQLFTLPRPLGRESAVARARATHPGLVAANARTRSLSAELEGERRARIPTFSLKAFTTQELDRRAYGVGLGVELPVFNLNAGGIAQAEAKWAASRGKAEAQAAELEAHVIQAEAACRSSLMTATQIEADVLPRSKSAASVMEKAYLLGDATLLEVIEARRTLLESRSLFLDALARAHVECSRLGALVGADP